MNIPIYGTPDPESIRQIERAAIPGTRAALMADHHLGYGVPIGGVVAYQGKVSPSGVGFDIACGNKAVMTDLKLDAVAPLMGDIMDEVFNSISFGMAKNNQEENDHPLFARGADPAWDIPVASELKRMAAGQLGTVGSGNHYVDIFTDEHERIWIGVHFGSRGLGHKLATHFIKAGGGVDGIHVDPVVLDAGSMLGQEYIACMKLAGRYAYAGRDWVCAKVARILGANIIDEVHNHHNFAWEERHFGEQWWVVRKGATPAFPGQRGFVGGSMGDDSVILEGVDSDKSREIMYSTVHGAGRAMSRTAAAGKVKWIRDKATRRTTLMRTSNGAISKQQMHDWISDKGVVLRGGGCDEAPQAYKRLPEVLDAHAGTIKILHTLRPLGVAMAGEDTFDPYKD